MCIGILFYYVLLILICINMYFFLFLLSLDMCVCVGQCIACACECIVKICCPKIHALHMVVYWTNSLHTLYGMVGMYVCLSIIYFIHRFHSWYYYFSLNTRMGWCSDSLIQQDDDWTDQHHVPKRRLMCGFGCQWSYRRSPNLILLKCSWKENHVKFTVW